VAVAGVLGLAAAVLVLAVTTWRVSVAEADLRAANTRLEQERALTASALRQEEAQRAKAERNFREAREVLDYLTDLAEVGLADRPEYQPVRRELLEKLLGYYRDFVEQHRDDPTAQAELLEAQYGVAAILAEVGPPAEALAALEQYRSGSERMPEAVPQLPPPGPFVYRRGLSLLFLGGQSSVQKDLGLTDSQVHQVRKLVGAPRGRSYSTEDDRAVEKALAEALTPAQLGRLQQIDRQHRGASALNDRAAAQALGLSDRQKKEIRDILESAHKKMWDRNAFGPPSEWRQRVEQFWRDIAAREQAVLTPRQRTRWAELLGEPFQGEIRFPSFGPRGSNGHPSGTQAR
jgi:hypothetical protein